MRPDADIPDRDAVDAPVEPPPAKFDPVIAVYVCPLPPTAIDDVLPDMVLDDDVIELIALVWL